MFSIGRGDKKSHCHILLLVLCVGYDLSEANAIKCLFSIIVSGVSLIIFMTHHEVDWSLGSSMCGGSIAGSWIGALLCSHEWIKVWIYRLLLVMISVEVCLLFMKYFWHG